MKLTRLFKYLAHAGSLFSLAWLLFDFSTQNLSVNPIQDLTLRTGKTALILLLLSLTITPLTTATGIRTLIPLRKIFGLYSAFYATLHFGIFVGLDYFFDWKLISEAIIEKPYVLVGFSGFIILAILAVTSTNGWKRRLKKRWKAVHKMVYAAGILVVFHYLWVVKSDIREPLVYGVILGVLLLMRLPVVQSYLVKVRNA